VSERRILLESIAETISDYREGIIPRRGPDKVERWVRQFAEDVQDEILAEMDHLLQRTYISRRRMSIWLRRLVTDPGFCNGDPAGFWRHANLLPIQKKGNSQRELLAILHEVLREELELAPADCGSDDGPFLYLDDGVYGGGHILDDLRTWVAQTQRRECEVRVVVPFLHTGGQERVEQKILAAYPRLALRFWRIYPIENRRELMNDSDVLWPAAVPSSAWDYVRYITEDARYPLALREGDSIGLNRFFSSGQRRHLLEQQFLIAGLWIRSNGPNLPETARPLGATPLKTFGFGATVVTFRNCPNNAPLALWADGNGSWYPLFPRLTNSAAAAAAGRKTPQR